MVIANEVAQDRRLSFAARGVLLDMLSRPPDWEFSADRIAAGSPDGRKTVQRCLRDLEAVGYVYRYRERYRDPKRDDGRAGFLRTVTLVSDEPISDWEAVVSARRTGGPVQTSGATCEDTVNPQVAPEVPHGTTVHGTTVNRPPNKEQRRKHRDNPPNPPPPPTSGQRSSNGRREAHPNEPNARRAIETMCAERALPLTVDALLALAYAADLDPWVGYRKLKTATTQPLDGARDPAAVVRKRLGVKTA